MNDCDRTLDALVAAAPLPPEVAAHTRGCPSCAALVRTDGDISRALSTPAPTEAPEALPEALRAAVRADPAPKTTRRWWRGWAVPLGALAGVAAVAWRLHPRADLGAQPLPRMALGALVALLGATTAWVAASHGGPSGLGWSTQRRGMTAVVLALGGVALVAGVTVAVEGSLLRGGLWAHMARGVCALEGVVVAAPLAVLAARELRGSAAADPVGAGLLVGLGAGFGGLLVQHLCCAVMRLDHTLVAHLLPLAVGALAGALSARRWATP